MNMDRQIDRQLFLEKRGGHFECKKQNKERHQSIYQLSKNNLEMDFEALNYGAGNEIKRLNAKI